MKAVLVFSLSVMLVIVSGCGGAPNNVKQQTLTTSTTNVIDVKPQKPTSFTKVGVVQGTPKQQEELIQKLQEKLAVEKEQK